MTATPESVTPPEHAASRCAIAPLPFVLADGRRLVLRALSSGDEDLMAEFFASLTAREIFYFFPLDEVAARRLAQDAEHDPACRLVAVGELSGQERILGYMFLDGRQECPPTFGACLRGEAQSGGLGRAMIDHLLTSAAASGIERAQLTVHADNWRALRLYQRAGFRVTGEFILAHQGAKQYRMEAHLQQPAPMLLDDLTLVARGGVGIGTAAVRVQEAIEAAVGRRPLILDRPVHNNACIIITDLAAPAERPFEMPLPPILQGGDGPSWIVSLDDRHLLIGGIGAGAVDRAARAYSALVAAHSADAPIAAHTPLASTLMSIPFSGLYQLC